MEVGQTLPFLFLMSLAQNLVSVVGSAPESTTFLGIRDGSETLFATLTSFLFSPFDETTNQWCVAYVFERPFHRLRPLFFERPTTETRFFHRSNGGEWVGTSVTVRVSLKNTPYSEPTRCPVIRFNRWGPHLPL